MLRDPAMETAKVRDGQASAFKQRGSYHKPLPAVKLFSSIFPAFSAGKKPNPIIHCPLFIV
jgi:hypothetical protein